MYDPEIIHESGYFIQAKLQSSQDVDLKHAGGHANYSLMGYSTDESIIAQRKAVCQPQTGRICAFF